MKPGLETDFDHLFAAIDKQVFLLNKISDQIGNPQNERLALPGEARVLQECIANVRETNATIERISEELRNHKGWRDLFDR